MYYLEQFYEEVLPDIKEVTDKDRDTRVKAIPSLKVLNRFRELKKKMG